MSIVLCKLNDPKIAQFTIGRSDTMGLTQDINLITINFKSGLPEITIISFPSTRMCRTDLKIVSVCVASSSPKNATFLPTPRFKCGILAKLRSSEFGEGGILSAAKAANHRSEGNSWQFNLAVSGDQAFRRLLTPQIFELHLMHGLLCAMSITGLPPSFSGPSQIRLGCIVEATDTEHKEYIVADATRDHLPLTWTLTTLTETPKDFDCQ